MLLYVCVVLAYVAQACDKVCGEFVSCFFKLETMLVFCYEKV